MSSTAPSKKPYRKAPPQHREIRHEVPIIRDDQDGVILAEQSQVTACRVAKGLAPMRQQTGLSCTEAGQLEQAEGFEVCDLNFSSSWSLESSSEKEVAGCRAELNVKSQTVLPALPRGRRMGQQSGKRCPNRTRGHLSKFVSRSMETVVVSGDEKHHPACSFKSRSLERSLMFKEPPEVLTPRKFRVSSTHLPLKGILKQTGLRTGTCPETLRKSRSVETLSRGRGSRKYSDPQLCLGCREKRSLERSSGGAADSVKRKEKLKEEKMLFSKFLDEITQRVLSPIRLRSLGETRGAEQNQNSARFPRGFAPESQGEGHLEEVKTKRAKERSLCPSRRKTEKKCEGLGVASCHRNCAEEAERVSILRKKPILGKKNSKEKLLSLERRVVDLCQYELQKLADLGLAGTSSGQQHSLSSWKSSAEGRRDESSPCSRLLQPHHLSAKFGQKHKVEPNRPEKESFSPPTHWSREEGPALPRSSPSFSLALNKVGARSAGSRKRGSHKGQSPCPDLTLSVMPVWGERPQALGASSPEAAVLWCCSCRCCRLGLSFGRNQLPCGRRKAGAGALLPTAGFPVVCRLEAPGLQGRRWAALLLGGVGRLPVLCVPRAWLSWGTGSLHLMAGSGLCKPSPLSSSLLRGRCLVLLEITLSPLPGHCSVLCAGVGEAVAS